MTLATFAGGCFWGIEKFFCQEFQSISTKVGYTGGSTKSPTYEQVCSGKTGHAEAVQITFDPKQVKYEQLCELFWTIHDPTTKNRQGNDTGSQYRSSIFYHSEEQREIAEKTKIKAQLHCKNPIMTEIVPAVEFFLAEEKHQKYLERNPGGYCNHYKRY